jgi:hypothetical protein
LATSSSPSKLKFRPHSRHQISDIGGQTGPTRETAQPGTRSSRTALVGLAPFQLNTPSTYQPATGNLLKALPTVQHTKNNSLQSSGHTTTLCGWVERRLLEESAEHILNLAPPTSRTVQVHVIVSIDTPNRKVISSC